MLQQRTPVKSRVERKVNGLVNFKRYYTERRQRQSVSSLARALACEPCLVYVVRQKCEEQRNHKTAHVIWHLSI